MVRWSMLAAAAAGLVSEAEGGAWTRAAGSGFVQAGISSIAYSRVYDPSAAKVDAPASMRDRVVQLYMEYGITDDITVFGALPFKFLSATHESPSTLFPASGVTSRSGMADMEVGVRAGRRVGGGTVLAGELMVGIPTGSATHPQGLLLGDGEANVELRFLAGRSFHPFPAYTSAAVGYNIRGAGFSHEVMVDIEAGVGLFEYRLMAILQLSVRRSLRTDPSPEPSAAPAVLLGLDTHNREWTAVVPKVLFRAGGGVGVVLSYATAIHGRSVAGGAVLAGSVLYEW